MRQSERKARRCAACGEPVGAATIVAGGRYPDAPLCLACGGSSSPLTCEEVYAMIEERLLTDPAASR